MRASHLHFMVSAPGQRTLVTHIFVKGDELLGYDTVFGVKDSLITDFEQQSADTPTPDGRDLAEQTWSRARFDLVLAPDTTATQPTAAEEQLAAPCGESTNNHSSE